MDYSKLVSKEIQSRPHSTLTYCLDFIHAIINLTFNFIINFVSYNYTLQHSVSVYIYTYIYNYIIYKKVLLTSEPKQLQDT